LKLTGLRIQRLEFATLWAQPKNRLSTNPFTETIYQSEITLFSV
jgi:hypothetical protein